MGLKYLPNIHTGRYTKGIENNLNGCAVFHVRHILFRQNAGQNTLVTVSTSHLIADRQLALDGDINLDHLDHTRRQIVATLDLFDLIGKDPFDQVLALSKTAKDLSNSGFNLGFIQQRNIVPARQRNLIQSYGGDFCPLLQQYLASGITNTHCSLAA